MMVSEDFDGFCIVNREIMRDCHMQDVCIIEVIGRW